MAPRIRAAESSDYESVCSLLTQGDAYHAENMPSEFRLPSEPGRPREWFDRLLAGSEDGAFVAELNDHLVGFVSVSMRSSPPYPMAVPQRFAYVSELVVDRDHRRLGVGQALMDAAESWGRQRGATECRLTVFAFNQAASALYEKLGYCSRSHALRKRL